MIIITYVHKIITYIHDNYYVRTLKQFFFTKMKCRKQSFVGMASGHIYKLLYKGMASGHIYKLLHKGMASGHIYKLLDKGMYKLSCVISGFFFQNSSTYTSV